MTGPHSITQLLNDWSSGDQAALAELTPYVYRELHALARSYLRRERQNRTLQPTALINEVYLRLAGEWKGEQWENRSHFFSIAASIMRRVLVDYARFRRTLKRGGGHAPVALEDAAAISTSPHTLDILDLHDALDEFEKLDQRRAKVIELRFFGGMSREEIAYAMDLTLPTVKRDLRLAEAWLRNHLAAKS